MSSYPEGAEYIRFSNFIRIGSKEAIGWPALVLSHQARQDIMSLSILVVNSHRNRIQFSSKFKYILVFHKGHTMCFINLISTFEPVVGSVTAKLRTKPTLRCFFSRK